MRGWNELLKALREIPHVEMIRIGTRMPVCLPMRVTDELAVMLRRYAPLFVITHFNHPKEITAEARAACERLVDHGVPVENQGGVDAEGEFDGADHQGAVARVASRCGCGRTTCNQMDVAEGCEHLRTPIDEGVKILEQLRGHTSGLAVPHPRGGSAGRGGKVTLQPQYVVERRCERDRAAELSW